MVFVVAEWALTLTLSLAFILCITSQALPSFPISDFRFPPPFLTQTMSMN